MYCFGINLIFTSVIISEVMVHVESEETQDNLRESLATSQEEAGEIGFVPGALGEPRGVYSWCDNRCCEKSLRFRQIASLVTEEGGDARTINLCQRWYNEKLVQQGKQSLKSKDWREVVERQAHRGRLWKIFGSEQLLRGILEYFNLKRAWARKFLADAAQEKNKNTRSVATRESFQRSFGASQRSADTDCNAQAIGKALQRGMQERRGVLRGFRRLMTRSPEHCTGFFGGITRTS